MERNTRTLSMTGVVASSGGSIAGATLAVLSATLVFANPQLSDEDVSRKHVPDVPTYTTRGLDLPVVPPVYDASKDGDPDASPDRKPKEAVDLDTPPERPEPDPGGDPSDEPPPVFFGEEITSESESIIYVIDNSGSMSVVCEPYTNGDGEVVDDGSRMDRAKMELRRSIAALPESFHFNVIAYDECVVSCFDETVEASEGNKDSAYGWISQVQPDGWTNTGLAVKTALGDKSNGTVVLLSDGAPNFMDCAMNYVGSHEQHHELIRSENTQGARIDTFGIGISGDPDARSFMQTVASDSGGTYVDIQ